MKNIRIFSSENFPFFGCKVLIYLNRRVFVMSIFKITQHVFNDQEGPAKYKQQ